jgi:hypothetical protein
MLNTSHQTALLDQWTQFLITDSLIPANQLSTDDFAGHLANQTNLAIKGIIGIKAMSQIAELLGDTAKGSNYSVRVIFLTVVCLSCSKTPVDRLGLRYAVANVSCIVEWPTFDTCRQFYIVSLSNDPPNVFNAPPQYGNSAR